jgi:adenosylcobinamide-phosphate synthase
MLATASEVWLLKTTFAVRALEEAARCVYLAMEAQDLSRARQAVAMLVSRPVDDLDDWHIASAAIESVAESTADSFVGPWFAYALIGLPGAVGYRVVNTLDSMIGYRGRYEHVGRVSARLDDLINLSISRLAAVCVVFAAWRPGTTARTAWHVMRRDHGLTASPNAGWPMAAMAGALGIVLEKPNQYRINDGAAIPLAFDIGRATNLMRRTAVVAAVATVLFVVLVKRGRSDAHE